MKQYIIDTFVFNDGANKQSLKQIKELTDPPESVRLFSHLINCQFKWMARVKGDPAASEMSWWDPLYALEELERKWEESVKLWMDYLGIVTEEQLNTEVTFIGFDGGIFAATPKDIALQLNYHSIHHRAQIQTLIRKQGIEPFFTDYIGTKYRKLN